MGIQTAISGGTFNESILACWLEYDHDLEDEGTQSEKASKKSIHHAVLATELFWRKYNAGTFGYLNGWEVAKFKDPVTGKERLGIELTYVIDIIDGFTDEGHIDLILYHPVKNRYMVVEIKTTGNNVVDEATYKYSDQPLGYGIVLDAIAAQSGGTASFDVLYLVWKSRTRELIAMPFSKSIRDRARWLRELLMDIEMIQGYQQAEHFPHRGESCFSFFRQCEHFASCKMTREKLILLSAANNAEGDSEYAEMVEPTFRFTIEQLLERQDQLVADIEAGKDTQAAESVDLLLKSIEVTNA
jgi:hypothetical protein